MIRLAGQNAGALCMSADRFVTELKAVKKAMAYRVEAAMAKVNGQAMRPEKLWGSNVFSANSSNNRKRVASSNNSTRLSKDASSASSSSTNHVLEGVEKTSNGRSLYTGRFGRGSVIIEDKRKKKKKD